MHWAHASFLSALFGAFYIMMFSQLVKHENHSRDVLHYMLCLYMIATVCIGCVLMVGARDRAMEHLNFSQKELLYVLGMSVFFVLSTYYFAKAFRLAPNPAFVTTIANSNMLIVLCLSLLAGTVLRWEAVTGVMLAFAGLSIMIYFGDRSTTTTFA